MTYKQIVQFLGMQERQLERRPDVPYFGKNEIMDIDYNVDVSELADTFGINININILIDF